MSAGIPAVPSPPSFMHLSQDQLTPLQQLPAHQITTASLSQPSPYHLEYPTQYGETTQSDSLPPSQAPFHQPPTHPIQPQAQLAQPQPANQPTSQPQPVGLDNEVPVTNFATDLVHYVLLLLRRARAIKNKFMSQKIHQ